MDYNDYKINQNKENKHFWFKAKNDLIDYLLDTYISDKRKMSDILSIGCGTGDELKLLRQYGNITAIDKNKDALDLIKNDNVNIIHQDLENNFTLEKKFDYISCFDVLEHIHNDQKALLNIHSLLKANGVFFFTVPAYQFLFSPHDKALEHVRRYSKREIQTKLLNAGFELKTLAYWNSLLLPPIIVFRLLNKLRSAKDSHATSDAKELNKVINAFFYRLMTIENKIFIPYLKMPAGLTIYGIAVKKQQS